MTRKSFYQSLRKIAKNFQWRVTKDGRIRGYKANDTSYKQPFCPITAVYYNKTGERVGAYSADRYDVIEEVGLDYGTTWQIIDAADLNKKESKESLRIREALLKAVALKKDGVL